MAVDLDYKKLGFMCGLEIHQRLATEHKLFCSCDAQLPNDVSIAEIDRRQRAVAGELGRIDLSAAFETQRGRKFVYNAFRKTTCLVDVDEEPPHEMNGEALSAAMQIVASFNAWVPAEFEPMRKEVVDGSDPSAFQRTLLVGHGGYMEFADRQIGVTSIFLEEESSGIEHSDSNMVIYNVDRLAIPLVEIDTEPEIRTPEEAKEVARRIGLLLRLTGRVQRGIGSIRQDVNVSIREGARVEIKGFQDLETMDKIIENEVRRQVNLIEIKKELQKRDARVHQPIDVTSVFGETNVKVLRRVLEDVSGVVMASRLQGYAGILGREINPGRRLGSEISDYAKLAGVGGLIHSDENLAGYGFTEGEMGELKRLLGMKEKDAFILVAGDKEACESALAFANTRAQQAALAVPNETRGVDSKMLITTFLRPLPGGARMYPETDVRPIPLDHEAYEVAKKLAVDVERITGMLRREIKNEQLEEQMLWSPYLGLFMKIVEKTKVKGSVVAPVLLDKMTQIRRMGKDIDSIGDEAMLMIFGEYAKGRITKAAIEEILKQAPTDGKAVEKAIKAGKLERIGGKELEKLVREAGRGKGKEEIVRQIMSRHRLNVDAEDLNNLLK
ncbi:MAG: Glu-tRNA(Gln) amidotransferase subunit GatE [Candidatus Micrarchaeota archaeon]|nr:Glu-tRNA(Gln) amidotransferase subunit GatE [Candidatus Micrarchaeota archaeon]